MFASNYRNVRIEEIKQYNQHVQTWNDSVRQQFENLRFSAQSNLGHENFALLETEIPVTHSPKY